MTGLSNAYAVKDPCSMKANTSVSFAQKYRYAGSASKETTMTTINLCTDKALIKTGNLLFMRELLLLR